MAPPETARIPAQAPPGDDLTGIKDSYEYGFHDPENYAFKSKKGLSAEVVEGISAHKQEPQWMHDFRLKALKHFQERPMPKWADGHMDQIDFQDIHYFVRASEKQGRTWDEVPDDIKNTFDKLGIPEAERKYLAGVGAQYECLAEEALVYTARGLVPIRDVVKGDTVFSLDESTHRLQPARVKANVHKGKRPVYEVKIGTRTVRATENHPFLCLVHEREPGKRRGRYQREWRYLRDLRAGDLVAVSKHLPDVGESVRVESLLNGRATHFRDQPIKIPEITSPALMWWLGVYLGDGFIHRSNGRKQRVEVALPAEQAELRAAMVDETETLFGVTASSRRDDRLTVGATQMGELIEDLGFGGTSHTKTLPQWVFSLPKQERLGLLAGYVDADGYVRDHAKNKDAIVTSANRELLDQVKNLALGCGLRCPNLAQFKYTIASSGDTAVGHRLMISGDVSHLPFRNPDRARRAGRHQYTHDFSSAKGTTFRSHVNEDFGFVRIRSIKLDGEADVYDIEVDGPHNFIAEGVIVHNSEVVYHQVREDLEKQGVIFKDMDTGLREHEDLVREYFATVIPPNDNKLAALNSAVWSGGSFVYVPPGVHVEMPLQAYFRINTENMGQFERTLIIADEGSFVHYIEGCHLAGSMVRVTDGEKPIEEIQPGEEVLTHEGRFRPVRETMQRPFKGPIFNIRFQGENYRSLAVTPRHPFLAVRRHRAREHNRVFAPEWLEAHELRKGDYLAVPTGIDLEWQPEDSPGILDQAVPVGRGSGPAVAERVQVALDEPMCRLIGLYLAEGTVTPNTSYLIFDSHRDETQAHDLVRSKMSEAFGITGWEYDYSGHRAGKSIRFSSVRAARFFEQSFGRTTAELHIPDWAFCLSESQRAALVRGVYDGEGSYDSKLDLYRISQTNQRVAQRLRELLLSLGIRASLSESERPDPRRSIWQIAIGKVDHPRFEQIVLGQEPRPQRATHTHSVLADGYLWQPISSIERVHAECTVYNMSVEDDESYVCEGVISHNCTAPTYTTDSLHSAVVEIICKPDSRVRYTTIQNWSHNVYNLVTKRAIAQERATMEWIDGNLGSKLTMKYPSIYLMGEKAHGEILSIAFAGDGQHQDAGGKVVHVAPKTTSTIISKSISKDGGRASYRGLLEVAPGATESKSKVVCDALLLDEDSRSDTYPTIRIGEDEVDVGHEATVSKIGEEQLFYLMSRGLTEEEASGMIVGGFIEPFTRELPMEYAVEMNRLIELQMEGSIG